MVPPAANSPSLFDTKTHALDRARALQLPSYEKMLYLDRSVRVFWDENEKLFEQAWKEWQAWDEAALALPKLDASIIHPKLRTAVERILKSVETGDYEQVKQNELQLLKDEIFQEVAPGVYSVQFFDMDKIDILRQCVGYWAAPDFQSFYKDVLIDSYIRPLSRLFFSDAITNPTIDSESFGFSIQYQAGGDESIRQHTDASSVTFNINLDKEKTWTGSSLYFWDRLNGDGKRYMVEWAPGMAMMHLGRTLHAALPIESGTRNNLVVWTMPKIGDSKYGDSVSLTSEFNSSNESKFSAEERWKKPEETAAGELEPWERWNKQQQQDDQLLFY